MSKIKRNTQSTKISDSEFQTIVQAGADPLNPAPRPELVFGLVGPVGVDRDIVCNSLTQHLEEYGYSVKRIRVSSLIKAIPRFRELGKGNLDEYQRIQNFMDAGTEIRKKSGLGDALAILAISEISRIRAELNVENPPNPKAQNHPSLAGRNATAYILDSLKHPDEVKSLRATYGRGFFLISAYASRNNRVESLALRIANSKLSAATVASCRSDAEKLVNKDEKEEGQKLGQNVLHTFPMADLFVDIDSRERPYQLELARFCEIIFANPFITPSIDEFGMFHAEAASWRSADLARQVGASICKSNGTLRAIGCNEVPSAGGGLYWEMDKFDDRDFRRGIDEGTRQKNMMVAEVVSRISELIANRKDKEKLELLKTKALKGEPDPVLDELQALNVIEYGRAVHAEMSALSDAARNGISVQDHTMYVNTFPCHICARHIIASGIRRVVYIQPYPKSFTGRMFSDSIASGAGEADSDRRKVVFQPFSGIAPRFYQFAFELTDKRKNGDGTSVTWTKANATTKLKRFVFSYIVIENEILNTLLPQIEEKLK